MIRRERGRVRMFLSDSRSVAYSLDAIVTDSLLEEFPRAAEALQVPSTEPDLPSVTSEVRNEMRRLGADLYRRFFPEPIQAHLAGARATYLSLQIQESLLRVPWELAFDGEFFLAEKFLVSRQVLSERQHPLPHEMRDASGEMRILMIGNGRHHRSSDLTAVRSLSTSSTSTTESRRRQQPSRTVGKSFSI